MRRGVRGRTPLVALVLCAALAGPGCAASNEALTRAGLGGRVAPDRLSQALRPYDEWFVPDGAGPFATAVLVPGCLGTSERDREWARELAGQGIAAVIVDSFVPRGYAETASREVVCDGRALWPFVRAGDLWVTLSDLESNPRVDPERVALVGFGHGARAVLAALAMDRDTHPPPTLEPVPRAGLRAVRAAVLVAPRCERSEAPRAGAAAPRVSLLLLLPADPGADAGPDARGGGDACRALAARLAASGLAIEVEAEAPVASRARAFLSRELAR